jgi:hypothetical protein
LGFLSRMPISGFISSIPDRVKSGLSAPRPAARPHGRRIGGAAREAPSRGEPHAPPLWQDGTERPIQRPKDPEEQQEYYSGKKKRHTLKHLLVMTEVCQMCFLSPPCEGKTSDISLAEVAGPTLPPGSCLYQDKGFQGFFLPGSTIVQPKKTPRGGGLTPPEQETNRRISSSRMRIEHAIGGVKRDRIVKDTIRLLKDGIQDPVMDTCCGLHNVSLLYRPWNYASSQILNVSNDQKD